EEAAGLQDYFSLFIPLAKAFVSDTAVQVASLAIQVHGGAGYTKDFPAEQYLRDARIFPIYEGTNGIQALDLVGRKLAQNGGAEIGRFTKETAEFLKTLEAHKGYEAEAEVLKQAADGFNAALGKYMEFLGQDKREVILLTATRFLDCMSRLLIARLLLEGALTAEEALGKVEPDSQDNAFYRGKIATGRYFARNLLPAAIAEAQVLASGDLTAMEIPDAGFSVAY
ncbi:MAG: acyl-CoA dehydrogenase C-terminal domain-containing protein, partial [SAR324 cluster bacterium]|nr:acyl-CoA dehydrogenase C-terminal domain-containing protein [SAR324 cluster bacterium]